LQGARLVVNIRSGAVFISYASQDIQAARRISDALLSACVTVWLDQSELRGGDSWDRQINQEIRCCTLFIPIVSAATEARSEGYFRREWRMAIERARDIAEDQAFIIPVVIDDTRQANARVPDQFRAVQWTRLRDGHVSEDFRNHILRLLRQNVRDKPTATSIAEESYARPSTPASNRLFGWRLVIVACTLLISAVLISLRLGSNAHTPGSRGTTPTPGGQTVVVLPFLDMSQGHDQEYFADGLTEELTDQLSRVGGLQVIARTSSFYFKGRSSTIQQIAQTLHVTHVLEGSVRKSGNALRITAQLVRAADGVDLWSKTYDRTLSDLFQIQTEISTQVTAALKIAIGGHTDPAFSTASVEAYNLQLEGNFYLGRQAQGDLDRAIEAFRQSLVLDPNYAYAWIQLGRAYVTEAGTPALDIGPGERLALDAVHRGLSLDQRSTRGWRVLGNIERDFNWNWEAASAAYGHGLDIVDDRNEEVRLRLEVEQLNVLRIGRYDADHFKLLEESLVLNPLDSSLMRSLALDYVYDAQYEKALAVLSRAREINPSSIDGSTISSYVLLLMSRFDNSLQELSQSTSKSDKDELLAMLLWSKGDKSGSDRYVAELDRDPAHQRFTMAQIYAWRGQVDLAFKSLEQSFELRESSIISLRLDPILRRLQSDGRYHALLRKLKLGD
jgi:TolB-like protein